MRDPGLIGYLWGAALFCAALAGLINGIDGGAALLVAGAAVLISWGIWRNRSD